MQPWNERRRRLHQISETIRRLFLETRTISALTNTHIQTRTRGKFRAHELIYSYLQTGKLQQTVANCIERTGRGLHSGEISTVKILPAAARAGRFFIFRSNVIRASIDNAVKDTPLCTALSKGGYNIRTVEHLLSALEACGVDNCHIEIEGSNNCDPSVEVFASFSQGDEYNSIIMWLACVIASWYSV